MSPFESAGFMITLLGTIGTVAAAVAATKSAMIAEENTKFTKRTLELHEENEAKKVQPLLVINNKNFVSQFTTLDQDQIIHQLNWDTSEFSVLGSEASDNVSLDLINLGPGYAKEIEINWEIENIKFLIEYINITEKDEFYSSLFIEEIERKEKKFINIKSLIGEKNDISQYYIKSIKPENYVYLAGNQNFLKINLPGAFVAMINIYNCLRFNLLQLNEKDFPIIKMDIKYKDLNDIVYTDKFEIKIYQIHRSYPVNGLHKLKFNLLPVKINK